MTQEAKSRVRSAKMNATTTNNAAMPTMDDANALVERYLAIWNERDAARRRALIAQLWTEDASYLDPLMRGEGHTAIDAMIQAAQEQFPGHYFRPRNRADAHNRCLRFSWELAPGPGPSVDNPAIVGGTDFATVATDGRLQSVTGFIDYMPGANA
jgi:hypothetical protein